MRLNQLNQWLSWMESLHSSEIDMGLTRIAQVANNLGVLEPTAKVISFAGTNGKGSTLTYCASILHEAGFKVGSFVSPHFEFYNERISIYGVPVSDQLLCESFSRIDAARNDISLTYFEFGALAALDIFKHQNVDFYLLEVGLGGRLDAVNCIDADIAVVTSIGLDHQDWLGSDINQIALEKSGISRPNHPVVCGEAIPPSCMIEAMKAQSSPLFIRGKDFTAVVEDEIRINETAMLSALTWDFYYQGVLLYKDLPIPKLPFQNAQTALAALQLLDIPLSLDIVKQGLARAWIAGRFEVISESPLVVVDVAHNPQAASLLSMQLLQRAPKWRALVSLLADKASCDVVACLDDSVVDWHVAGLDVHRGQSGNVLAQDISGIVNAQAHESVDIALDALTEKNDLPLVIFGSFYTVAQAKRYFHLRNNHG
jgi:dihydrofolate synthase/folylpolyglutamate synthase